VYLVWGPVRGWEIEQIIFPRLLFRGRISRVHRPNCNKFAEDMGRSLMCNKTLFWILDVLIRFETRAPQKQNLGQMWKLFSPVKIRGQVGEMYV